MAQVVKPDILDPGTFADEGVVRVNGLSRLARSLSVQECKTPSGISTVRPRSSGSL